MNNRDSTGLRRSAVLIGVGVLLMAIGYATQLMRSLPYFFVAATFIAGAAGAVLGLVGLFLLPGAVPRMFNNPPRQIAAYAITIALVTLLMSFIGFRLGGVFGAVALAVATVIGYMWSTPYYLNMPTTIVAAGIVTLLTSIIGFLWRGPFVALAVVVAGVIVIMLLVRHYSRE